jgi:hypothetical protein
MPPWTLGTLRHELRLVAKVNEDHAVQLIALQHSPTPSGSWVQFVVAFPGPLDAWLAGSCRCSQIHVTPDVAKLEMASPIFRELDERLDLLGRLRPSSADRTGPASAALQCVVAE